MGDYEFKEVEMENQDLNKLKTVLSYFRGLARHYNLPYSDYEDVQDITDRFLVNYVELSKYQKDDIALYLKKQNYNKQALLNEYIYDYLSVNPLVKIEDVPIINKVTTIDNKTILETDIGKIKLGKASEYFKDTKSSYIFDKKLHEECFDRTLEFVRENEDYDAVVSYVPHIFKGGHYHAYAKSGDTIVDPASNAIYFDNTGELIEKGDIIFTDRYSNIGGEIGEEIPYLLKKTLK